MFKKSSKINSNKSDLSNLIEGCDLYNSLILDKLREYDREKYEIRTFSYRPDLIAKDIYGSESYTGILILTSGIRYEQFVKGQVIEIYPKSVIDSVINGL